MARISDKLEKIKAEKKELLKKTTKKMAKKPKTSTQEVEQERKGDAVEYFNSLSETEKVIFTKEKNKR